MGEIRYDSKRFNRSNKRWIVRRSTSEPQKLLSERACEEEGSSKSNGLRQTRTSATKNRKFSLRISLLNFLNKSNPVIENNDDVETSLISPVEGPSDGGRLSDDVDQMCGRLSTQLVLYKTLHYTHSTPQDLLAERFPSQQRTEQWDANSICSLYTAASEFPSSYVLGEHHHRALQVPEILKLILEYVDVANVVPHEVSQRRRKPMSPRHAILIYGDTPAARAAWKQAQNDRFSGPDSGELFDKGAGLHNCMLVCRQWHDPAYEVMYERLHFCDHRRWKNFIENGAVDPVRKKPSVLVLHKVSEASQQEVNSIDSLGGRLKWLEFYTCPNIAPTKMLLSGQLLTRIVLPGCTRVDDRTCYLISQNCHQLEHLDLRACEQVTDRGLKAIAKTCHKLKLLNVGRTSGGEMITFKGVKHIVRRTQVNTLGLAGCFIDDRTVWEIARTRGHRIERLSLNNCHLLTDRSIPQILPYTKNLSVLELRGCVQITNMKPIVRFRKYKERIGSPALIEGCEIFEFRMKEAEWLMEMETSREILKDCLEWIYMADGDVVDWREAVSGKLNEQMR